MKGERIKVLCLVFIRLNERLDHDRKTIRRKRKKEVERERERNKKGEREKKKDERKKELRIEVNNSLTLIVNRFHSMVKREEKPSNGACLKEREREREREK